MEWTISTVSGGRFCRAIPQFTEKSIIITKGRTIAALSLTTHEANYLLIDHPKEITSFLMDLNNGNNLYSCAVDGTIRYWNIKEEKCLMVYELGEAVHEICVDYCDFGCLYVLVDSGNVKNHKWTIMHYNLQTKDREEILVVEGFKPHIATKRYVQNNVALGNKRGYEDVTTILVITHDTTLSVFNSTTKQIVNHKHNFPITVQCFHPTEDCIAIGDRTGKILLYRNLLEPSLIPSVYHWHSTRVNAISFSYDGLLMFSGGLEGVLVIWQLETGNKTYLPRLGSTIQRISSSNTQTLLCLGDNSIKLYNIVNMVLQWSINGFALSQDIPTNHVSNMLTAGFHGSKDLLLTAQYNGYIQFYNPLKDKSVYELNIFRKNAVTQTGTSQYGIEVIKFVVNNSAKLIVTLERFAKGTPTELYTLKFWILKSEPFDYVLNSSIENPHNGIISAIYVHPFLDIVITGDTRGYFKVWKPTAVEYNDLHAYNISPFKWINTVSGEYNGNKINSITLSTDGSVFVLGTENIVTLWTIKTVTLLKTITFEMKKTIKSIHNLHNTEYYVVQLNSSIEIYSYITGLPFILLPIASSVLRVDECQRGQFGFLVNEGQQTSFVLYNIYSKSLQCLMKSHNLFITFSFVTIEGDRNVLFFSENNELVLLSKSITASPTSLLSEEVLIRPSLPTPYDQAFGITSINRLLNDIKKKENSDTRKFRNIKGSELKDYLSAPSHLLPLPSVISEVYFDGLLLPTIAPENKERETQYSHPSTIQLK